MSLGKARGNWRSSPEPEDLPSKSPVRRPGKVSEARSFRRGDAGGGWALHGEDRSWAGSHARFLASVELRAGMPRVLPPSTSSTDLDGDRHGLTTTTIHSSGRSWLGDNTEH